MDDVPGAKLFAPAFVDVIAEYGKKDAHVGDDEMDWIPYVVEHAYWKPLRFDVASGRVYAPLWFKQAGVLGRHQHHGSVLGFCVEGSWFYKEYDWVARPGSLISESPGGVHTLCTETGMKTLFILEGQIDFFGDDNGFLGSQNVFWFIDEYLKHCKANNRPINQRLFYA